MACHIQHLISLLPDPCPERKGMTRWNLVSIPRLNLIHILIILYSYSYS